MSNTLHRIQSRLQYFAERKRRLDAGLVFTIVYPSTLEGVQQIVEEWMQECRPNDFFILINHISDENGDLKTTWAVPDSNCLMHFKLGWQDKVHTL